jgi:hypothetical protein
MNREIYLGVVLGDGERLVAEEDRQLGGEEALLQQQAGSGVEDPLVVEAVLVVRRVALRGGREKRD